MKKKKLFKNKLQMVIYLILFIICIALFIVIEKIDFKKDIDTDAEKFSDIYDLVSNDNLYVFATVTDVLDIINGKSGIILMGFPTNSWTNYYAKYLNEVAKELNIDKIYYYDFLSDRENNNGTYETIVNKLKVYVPTDDEGNVDLQAPTVLIVKDGEVLAYFDDTSIIRGNTTPDIYYNNYQINLVKEEFKTALEEYIK